MYIDHRTKQISKLKCNLRDTEAILTSMELQKIWLPNGTVNSYETRSLKYKLVLSP